MGDRRAARTAGYSPALAPRASAAPTPAATPISGTSDGRTFVRVANGGSAIPADQVESLFEPFCRLDGRGAAPARGAGLGLSIVRSVARAHGGDAHARALAEGGLEVTALLPTRTQAPRPSRPHSRVVRAAAAAVTTVALFRQAARPGLVHA